MVTTGKLNIELEIYRLSDHALVKSMTVKALIPPSLSKNDQDMAAETGSQVAHQIRQALTSVSLSNIPPAPQKRKSHAHHRRTYIVIRSRADEPFGCSERTVFLRPNRS